MKTTTSEETTLRIPTRKCLNEHDSGETMKAQPRHSTYSCIRTEAGSNPIYSMDIQSLNST